MMFVDASAIVAILTCKPEANALADRLDAATGCNTSPSAVLAAALTICRTDRASVPADEMVALEAFARHGNGQPNPAQLDLGSTSLMRWRVILR